MLGLAILFGLAVWLIITIFATIIGYETGKKTGAFIGFMLTMGGWIFYWILEYHYIQYKVNHLCKTEGGVTVYVTPEEYKVRLKSNNFDGLPKIEYFGDSVLFDGFEYISSKNNDRLVNFYSYVNYDEFYIFRTIFFDKKTNIVLLSNNGVSVFTPSFANDLSGLKFWRGLIKDCAFHKKSNSTENLYINFQGAIQ